MKQYLLRNKPLIFVVISVIVIAMIYSQSHTSYAAEPNVIPPQPMNPNFYTGGCADMEGSTSQTCCWDEPVPANQGVQPGGRLTCQTCDFAAGYPMCSPEENPGEVRPTIPPISVLPEGVLEVAPAEDDTAPSTVPPRTALGESKILNETVPPTADGGGVSSPSQDSSQGDDNNAKRMVGITNSPTGYCLSTNKNSCIPCDPGLRGITSCIPQSEWPGNPTEFPFKSSDSDVTPPESTSNEATDQGKDLDGQSSQSDTNQDTDGTSPISNEIQQDKEGNDNNGDNETILN